MELTIENEAIMQKILLFLSKSDYTAEQLSTLCMTYDYFDNNDLHLSNNIRNINITAYYKPRVAKSIMILYNLSFISIDGKHFYINPVTKLQLNNFDKIHRERDKAQKVCLYLKQQTFEKINKILKEFENENKQNIFVE